MERPDLIQFQRDMKRMILTGDKAPALAAGLAETAGVPAAARLDVHVNNYRETLSSSLAGMFPVLEAFVGSVFVQGALKEFVTAHPPEQASLAGYGGAFADFLAGHEASNGLPYIVDIVRLEWVLHELQLVDERAYGKPGGVEAAALRLSDNVRLVASDYPLMSLWSVGTGQIPPAAVHLDQGGQTVAALLHQGEISLIALTQAEAEALAQLAERPKEVGEADIIDGLRAKELVIAV